MNLETIQISKFINFAANVDNEWNQGVQTAEKTTLRSKKHISRFNHSARNNTPISYLVIHDTGNTRSGADADAHARYFAGGDRKASAHYFVDSKGFVQTVEDKDAAWHCGDGMGRYGITNRNSIGIELCVNRDGDYDLTFVNAAVLVVKLMKKYKIPLSRVVRHYDASRKLCPKSMSDDNWAQWHEFLEIIKLYS